MAYYKSVAELIERVTKNGDKSIVLDSNERHSEDDIRSLAEFLKTNKTIHYVSLENCNLDDNGAKALAEMLKINTSITYLSIRYNHLTPSGMTAITEALQSNCAIINIESDFKHKNPFQKIITDILSRNEYINDALLDYTKMILGAKIVQAIDRDTNIPIEHKNMYFYDDLAFDNKVSNILYNNLSPMDIYNFGVAWHSRLQQQNSLSVKDYNGIEWPSLFGSKELNIPENIIGKSGYKVVARTNSTELRTEGAELNHCVGGYPSYCLTGRSHIISVVNPEGKPISTLEYQADYEKNKLTLAQHYGHGNSEPCQESIAAQKWFEQQISSGNINIDYKGLEAARFQRKANANTLEKTAVLDLGFNPLNKQKFQDVIATYKDMADTTTKGIAAKGDNPAVEPVPHFRKNFDALLNLQEITLSFDTQVFDVFGEEKTFSLVEPKKVIERPKGAEGDKAKKQSDTDTKVLQNLQTSFDKIFGEGAVIVSVVEKSEHHKNGKVMLTPKEGVDISKRLDNHPKLKDKFEKTEGGYKSKLPPLPMSKLLEEKSPPKKALKQTPQEKGLQL